MSEFLETEESMSSADEVRTTLEEWAGHRHLSLTVVFTDIVKSTQIGSALGDTKWIDGLSKHFAQARSLSLPMIVIW
jgi:class 3 adenylate cyclase